MTGGTVHVLHVARGHVVASDNLNAGSRLGVLDREDDVPASQQKTLQHAVDQLATPESPCTANSSTPPNSTFADLIVQRASYVQISVEPDSAEEARFQVRSGVSSHDVGTSNWPPTGTSSGHQWPTSGDLFMATGSREGPHVDKAAAGEPRIPGDSADGPRGASTPMTGQSATSQWATGRTGVIAVTTSTSSQEL